MQALASPFRNLVTSVLFMAVVMVAATIAYVTQGWSVGDAIYMVVVSVYTVGYGEVRPIDTTALRSITIALIVAGCTGMLFVTGSLIQIITLSQFQAFFGVRRMQKDIDKLRDHVIICGFGRMGRSLALDLKGASSPFVVLEVGESRIEYARSHGYLCLQGDATDEEVLDQAGIHRARALATVLPDDATNVFITLSARSLNKKLFIIARGEIPQTESKLVQAGADRVVLPAHIGAERMAEMLLFKDMGDLRDSARMVSINRELSRIGFDFDIVIVAKGSRAEGSTVANIERIAQGAFMIAAVEKKSGSTIFQPPINTAIEAGDGVAVVGRPTRTEAMMSIFMAPDD